MKTLTILIFFSFLNDGMATPPRSIPNHLIEEYNLGNQIPIHDWYIDGTCGNEPVIFKSDEINYLVSKAEQRQEGYYGSTDQYLYALLDQYKSKIEGKNIAIIGSTTPWYESIILAYGGRPTTIEYNTIINEDPRLHVLTVAEFEQNPQKFDSIVSISSIEHDGLGRYGDPINPQGDLEAMEKIKSMLNEGGLLFLAIPVGQDAVYWNAHRLYGRLRLPLLFKGWDLIDSSGFSEADFEVSGYTGHQPVFVLRPTQLPSNSLKKNGDD